MKTTSKQTAVEWLALYIKGITSLNCDEVIQQAKEMEKEQIIYSNYNGQSVDKKLKDIDIHLMKTKAEQYYKETYESNI